MYETSQRQSINRELLLKYPKLKRDFLNNRKYFKCGYVEVLSKYQNLNSHKFFQVSFSKLIFFQTDKTYA